MTDLLPLFPLGTVHFPGTVLPLHVFEERYRALVQDLLAGPEPRTFGVVAIREGHEVGVDSVRALYDVGCVTVLARAQRLPDGRFMLVTVGTRRFRIVGVDHSEPYLRATVELLDESVGDGPDADAAAVATRQSFETYRGLLDADEADRELPDDPTALSYAVAGALALDLSERQAILETPDTAQRLRRVATILTRELSLIRDLRTVPMPKPLLPPGSQN